MAKDSSQWVIYDVPNTTDTYGRPVEQAKCSECGFTWADIYSAQNYFKYCPGCGRPMSLEGRVMNGANG